jgi:hypothetical protein
MLIILTFFKVLSILSCLADFKANASDWSTHALSDFRAGLKDRVLFKKNVMYHTPFSPEIIDSQRRRENEDFLLPIVWSGISLGMGSVFLGTGVALTVSGNFAFGIPFAVVGMPLMLFGVPFLQEVLTSSRRADEIKLIYSPTLQDQAYLMKLLKIYNNL